MCSCHKNRNDESRYLTYGSLALKNLPPTLCCHWILKLLKIASFCFVFFLNLKDGQLQFITFWVIYNKRYITLHSSLIVIFPAEYILRQEFIFSFTNCFICSDLQEWGWWLTGTWCLFLDWKSQYSGKMLLLLLL